MKTFGSSQESAGSFGVRILHAKAAKAIVVDRKIAFVTFASLTEAAHNRNIEVGVLIRLPRVAERLHTYFWPHPYKRSPTNPLLMPLSPIDEKLRKQPLEAKRLTAPPRFLPEVIALPIIQTDVITILRHAELIRRHHSSCSNSLGSAQGCTWRYWRNHQERNSNVHVTPDADILRTSDACRS